MSNPPSSTDKPPVRVWRRILLTLGGLVAVLVAVGFLSNYIDVTRNNASLRELEAHLDETDPNWRIDEFEKARAEIPTVENSARQVVLVSGLLPHPWPNEKFDKHFYSHHLSSPHQLNEEQINTLNAEMQSLAPALAAARKLADMPRGRHFLEVRFNPITTLLTDQQNGRQAAAVLSYDALDLAQKGDLDGALRSCRAIVNAGRAIGDEPFMISALIRISAVAMATERVERVLSQGEASEQALEPTQALLAMEDEHPTMRVACRGERGMSYDLISKMVDGRISAREMMGGPGGDPPTFWERMFGLGISKNERLHNLRVMTRLVELTKLPEQEQLAAEKQLEADVAKLGRQAMLTKMLLPAAAKVGEACRRKQAQVRSTMTAVACERYRLEQKQWPERLEQLVPKYLKAVPTDPYTGKPLRYKKTAEGVIVYSVGGDLSDDGGVIDRNKSSVTPGTDQGCRLWDVKARRKPALARPKAEGEAGELPGR